MVIRFSMLLSLCAAVTQLSAQVSDSTTQTWIEGYAELYYAYDNLQPDNHTRPGFIYAYNRSNELALNIGLIKLGTKSNLYRGNVGLMTGTYANANLSNEPGLLKMVYEANVGIKLSKKNIWLDAGVFTSHIGYESAVGKDCWTLSRSLTADNTPYFETGIKLSYNSQNDRWYLAALALNGWQRIQKQDGNNVLSLGTQVTYKLGDKLSLNSSTFIGSNTPDSALCWRYFHNFYGTLTLSKRLQLLAGIDYGIQQKNKNSTNFADWWSYSVLLKYQASEKISVTARSEMYEDANNIMIQSNSAFTLSAYSLNVDWKINSALLWRIEPKFYHAQNNLFEVQQKATPNNVVVQTLLAISL